MLKRKLKVYLDMNMVCGLFKEILQTIFEGGEFMVPWKIQIIHDSPDKIEPFASFLR